MVIAINFSDLNFKQWLVTQWRRLTDISNIYLEEKTKVIHTVFRVSHCFDQWRDVQYKSRTERIRVRRTQHIWHAWKRSFILKWKLFKLLYRFAQQYRYLLLSRTFREMWPGYDNLIKAQSMRKDILTRRALGGNAVAVLVEDATSFKRRQEEMRIAQEEEAVRKLHEMIEHEDPYHIRFSYICRHLYMYVCVYVYTLVNPSVCS